MPFVGIGVGVGRQRFAGGFADSYSSRVLANGGTIEALSCVANASTLLQQASLLFIPSGYKASVAYSALPNNGNGDLTWSRNSVANRTQSNGNIGSVAANVPRLSYMYGSCPALLLEPQRTNLVLRSEEFNTSPWFNSGTLLGTSTTVTNNVSGVIAPDGTQTASLVVMTRPATSNLTYLSQIQSLATTGIYKGSVYIKAKDATEVGKTIRVWQWDGAERNTRTVTLTLNWQRVETEVTSTLPSGSRELLAMGFRSGQGTDLNVQFHVWGGQGEFGSYATTYIPTTSATATRLVDTFTRNNIYTNGLISASGGTWYLEMLNNIAYTRDAAAQGIGIGDSSTTIANGFLIVNTGTGRQVIQKIIASATTNLFTTTTDTIKIAIKWNGTTADVFINGSKQVSATAFTTTLMEFLNGTGAGIPRWIKTMALYPTPLSDAQCQTLTT